nr:MAG TPA: hypothetical protein [Caudoviricetes sp.]
MFHYCADTGCNEEFDGMGFHINLCLSALYNKETKQYEITKEQLWESFKAQMENEDNISHKVLYCNSCGKTKTLQYGTILPVRKEVK